MRDVTFRNPAHKSRQVLKSDLVVKLNSLSPSSLPPYDPVLES
jgi:hypothetical protein